MVYKCEDKQGWHCYLTFVFDCNLMPNEKFLASKDNVKELKTDNLLKIFGTSEELTEFVEESSAKALSQDLLIKLIRKIPMD